MKNLPSICLYGNSKVGAGWLASWNDKLLGNGEPKLFRSMTEAVWQALDELRQKGYCKGKVWVYAAGGQRKAMMDVQSCVYYGDLHWVAAEQYEVAL